MILREQQLRQAAPPDEHPLAQPVTELQADERHEPAAQPAAATADVLTSTTSLHGELQHSTAAAVPAEQAEIQPAQPAEARQGEAAQAQRSPLADAAVQAWVAADRQAAQLPVAQESATSVPLPADDVVSLALEELQNAGAWQQQQPQQQQQQQQAALLQQPAAPLPQPAVILAPGRQQACGFDHSRCTMLLPVSQAISWTQQPTVCCS